VGKKLPNPWGLHDMHGNVWEWVLDWYEFFYVDAYKRGACGDGFTDWANLTKRSGQKRSARVFRGGDSTSNAEDLRPVVRCSDKPGERYDNLGFRLVRPVRR
jgi:formylglycine-generating enzyme required for sulfatase activity